MIEIASLGSILGAVGELKVGPNRQWQKVAQPSPAQCNVKKVRVKPPMLDTNRNLYLKLGLERCEGGRAYVTMAGCST